MNKPAIIFFTLLLIIGCDKNSIEEAKVFGTKEFISSEWNSSDIKNRSMMVYSFLNKYNVKNMSRSKIYDLLGPSTAYYKYDEFPAYNIVLNGNKYIIAFPINRKTSKIRRHVFYPKLK